MAKVNLTNGAITIEIADPVELERLIVVLHRTRSTKVIAMREAILRELGAAAPEPAITEAEVEAAIMQLEMVANGE